MNRKSNEINEEIIKKYVYRSMMAYPSDVNIAPIIFHFNISRLIEATEICQYKEGEIKCRLCKSFFNPYCQISENSDNWRCSVCGSINRLPLPPSDSILTAYSIIKNSICYNNALFDFIPSHLPIRNHQKPKIIVAIQSIIFNQIKFDLQKSLNENDLFSYALILFDSSLQLFDFHLNAWHIISDSDENDKFLFPTKIEYLFSNSKDLLRILSLNKSFSSNSQCDIENVCKFMNNFKNAKLLLILSGPVTSPVPSISFPASIVFYENENSQSSIQNFNQWSSNLTTFFIRIQSNAQSNIQEINQSNIQGINQNINQGINQSIIQNTDQNYIQNHFKTNKELILHESSILKLRNFLSKSLSSPFKSNIVIKLHAPKIFNINQENQDFRFFTVGRCQSSVAQLLSFVQFEISYDDCINDGISVIRIINIKIPLSIDPKIYRSSTFPNPLQHLFVASGFILARFRDILANSHKSTYIQIRNQLFELAVRFPLTDSYWENFIYKLISPDYLNDPIKILKRDSIFLNLKNLPIQFSLLHFLPLQFVDDKLLPLFPKEFKNAVARVTENAILILSDIGPSKNDIVQKICKLIDMDESVLPVIEVEAFEEVLDEENAFNKWKHDYELFKSKFLEEIKKK